jgi:hypothetical protein
MVTVEVRGLNIGPETGYPDWRQGFSQSPQLNCLNQGKVINVYVLFKSLSTANIFIVWPYTVITLETLTF